MSMSLSGIAIAHAKSFLFVPGDRPERFAKALASSADVVIADLEDAVAPENKAMARAAVAEALQQGMRLAVRINAAESEWYDADVAMCLGHQVACVVLPKAEHTEVLTSLKLKLGNTSSILPLIESALGISNVRQLAASDGVARLLFGSIDLQLDLGIGGEQYLSPFRLEMVLASRLANIAAPVDGVTAALDDEAILAEDSCLAKALGFTGKLCIHPKQLNVVNSSFLPSSEELDWAKRVVAASLASSGAAIALDGKMIDKPVLEQARRLLAINGGS